jgi:hypothetical protein
MTMTKIKEMSGTSYIPSMRSESFRIARHSPRDCGTCSRTRALAPECLGQVANAANLGRGAPVVFTVVNVAFNAAPKAALTTVNTAVEYCPSRKHGVAGRAAIWSFKSQVKRRMTAS